MPPLQARHEALYTTLYTDPRVMSRIGAPLSPTHASRAFAAALAALREPDPALRTWALHEHETGRALGIGAMLRREHDVEIGLMLLPAGWNARYSHEVIDALVAHAFDELGIERLVGICRAGPNERMSRRLLQAHGFRDVAPERPGTAQWALDRPGWLRPVGTRAAAE
ncbi:MAG TPA: GNAT family N-acetyltransferase [Lysobacter sp.]|nr:GNAT family N-acetyltransferase [Lysobacter sp.]